MYGVYDKVDSDVKALMSAELEAWRKLKSPKEQKKKKQLTYYYFYGTLNLMSMAEKEEMMNVLLARNCCARKK